MTTPEKASHAKFNPLIKPFLVVKFGFAMVCTIVGIPLAVIWFLGVGRWWAQHYYDRLECQLGDTTLRYRKGILVQVEKTIPLENIQDVTFVEGPILRQFHLSTLKFETAGHNLGQAGDMHLTGIMDAHEFRNRILAAREALKLAQRGGASVAGSAVTDARVADQLATLRGIERKLDDIIGLLKERKQ
jgi:membrane protein YdbS with pleckstrin-like domain